MSLESALALAFGIGIVAGLRSLTAPAIVAWATHLGWINLHGSHLSFMGSFWSVAIFTVLALAELVADQLPSTPSRTAPVGLFARIITGMLAGACLAFAGSAPLWAGALFGGAGGIVGAFAGHSARVGLVRVLKVRDLAIALPEDLVAIGAGLFLVSRF